MPPKKRAKVYSRTFVGCWTCRRRKIKCDATRPHCLRCTKSKLNCEGYGVKLNWSTPLVVKDNNEFGELDNDDGSDVEETSSFQRSNIQLCKWSIYNYYEDIDEDLELLDLDDEKGIKGPFTVFRYKEYLEPQLPPQRIVSISLSKTSSPISIITSDTIHPNLIPFAKLTIRIKNLPSNLPLRFPLPPEIPYLVDNTPIFHIINEDSITISKKLLDSINYFINIIPNFFQNQTHSFNNHIEFLIKKSLGEFMINLENKQLFYLLSTIQLASILYNININNYFTYIDEIISLHKATKSLHDSIPNHDHDSETTTLATILLIMINSTLGIYDPLLFQHQTTLDTMTHQMYKFIISIDQLLNSFQYEMDHKYSKFYEDLNQDYNLLTDVTIKPKNMKNGYGKIIISTHQTSRDQIMKIPKHRTNEDNESSDDDDERPPPPSFHINFASAEDEESQEDEDDEDQEIYDQNSTEGELVLFADLDTIDTQGTIFGISKILIYVFEELVKLVNHKRIFNKIGMSSRNFPKVIADFEDLLIRVNDMYRSEDLDDLAFYNCLVLLYYKLVRNYPSHMLNYHFKQIDDCFRKGCNKGIIWFIKNALDKKKDTVFITNDQAIWSNNWSAKQLIFEMNQSGINDDWDSTFQTKKIDGLFIL